MELKLQKFYAENNFKFDKKLAYGIYRNRVLSVLETTNNIKVTVTFNQQLTQELGQTISNAMGKVKSEHKVLRNAITTNIYLELIFFKSADVYEELMPALDKVLDSLDSLNLNTCEVCPFCGRALSTIDPFVKIRDTVVQGHEECVSSLIDQSKKITATINNEGNKSILKTTIISLLVMLLMVGIQVLLAFTPLFMFFSILTGVLFLWITRALCHHFKAVGSTKGLVIISIISVVTILLSFYLSNSIMLHRNFEPLAAVSIGNILANFFTYFVKYFHDIGSRLLIDLIINFVFTGSSLFMYFKGIYDSNNQIKRLS